MLMWPNLRKHAASVLWSRQKKSIGPSRKPSVPERTISYSSGTATTSARCWKKFVAVCRGPTERPSRMKLMCRYSTCSDRRPKRTMRPCPRPERRQRLPNRRLIRNRPNRRQAHRKRLRS
uniref:(northern house mosquito) hypothetical protein n=1 Tax=Culex pipiens TaxID=7175 RepID=A0A8D8HV74_CULPI